MQLKLTALRVFQWVCILSATVVTVVAYKHTNLAECQWQPVGWFVVLATMTELLAVNLADGTEVAVTPSSPIYWAAACVLGVLPSIAVCLASSVSSDVIASSACNLARWRSARHKATFTDLDDPDAVLPLNDALQRLLRKTGRRWESTAGFGLLNVFEFSANYTSLLILIVSLSGTAYQHLGGKFLLLHGIAHGEAIRHFIVPFLGLAAVAICVDTGLYAIAMVSFDPVPGAKGTRAIMLRMQLALIQTASTIARAQMFLVIVSIMLCYLYMRLGPLGFVLTGLPVVALRDFYYQWVQEQSAYLDTISTLATYMQHYHPYTRGHLKRVAGFSERLARELRLPADSIRRIGHAGLLHDIGKIAVSEEILDKTGKLEKEEWETIKLHPVAGAQIIAHLDFLEGIVDWIKYHHKWYDGRGYPDTNGNSMIPLEASIIAVADSFDAMTDDREMAAEWVCDSCRYKPEDDSRPEICPKCGAAKVRAYREPKTLDEAIDELRRGSGSQFHPQVVKAFLAMVERDGVHFDVG